MKKNILVLLIALILTIPFFRIYMPNSVIKNASNDFTVIALKGNAVFENADGKSEIKNGDSSGLSFLYIKDVGGKWHNKTFDIRAIADGSVDIILSGTYEGLSDSPTIFVEYKNMTVDGESIFDDVKTGRNDRAGLAVFNQNMRAGEILNIGLEYKNPFNYFSMIGEARVGAFLFIFVCLFILVFVLFHYKASKQNVGYFLKYVFMQTGLDAPYNFFSSPYNARKICNAIILVFVIAAAYFILMNPFFGTEFDDYVFLASSAIDKPIMLDLGHHGRYYPLTLQQYSFLKYIPFGYTPIAHYFLNALLFALMVFAIVKLLDFNLDKKAAHIYLKTFIILCFPLFGFPVIIPFTGLFYSDIMVCVLFAYFILFYKKALGSCILQQKFIWYLLALGVGILATYFKEPVFGALLIIAISSILFLDKKDRLDKYFNTAIIINGIIFIIAWFWGAYIRAARFYIVGTVHTYPTEALILIPILSLIYAFAIIRAFFIIVKKDREHVFYDAVLFASAGYISAYLIVLKMANNHYFAPAIILFLPVLAYWTIYLWDRKKIIAFGLIILCILLFSISGFRQARSKFLSLYEASRIAEYNMLKIDMFAKNDSPILFYPKTDYVKSVELYYCDRIALYLNYVNTMFFARKTFDPTETIKTDYNVRPVDDNTPIDDNAIYISDVDLIKQDPRFKNFVYLGYGKDWGDRIGPMYSFIHKDKI